VHDDARQPVAADGPLRGTPLNRSAILIDGMGNQTMKNLIKPENEAEANVIKSILEEHGIYAEIKSFRDTAYDGLFQSQYGWGLIRVSERDFSEAQRIVEEWKNASPGKLPWDNKLTDA